VQRPADLEGVFSLATDAGRPVQSGFRPNHRVHENYETSGEHEYVGVTQVQPGESAQVRAWLITPHVYPRSLWPGRVLVVSVGSRRIGTLTVVSVLNPILRGSSESYSPQWSVPPGLA
jgi:hypothetical protein